MGLDARNEMRMAKQGRKVRAYKNPRVAYCLRRREEGGQRGRGYEGREPGKQDRFYSSLGIIPGSRRSYIVLTLSGLPNYPWPPTLPRASRGPEKCPFTLFAASRLFFVSSPSLPSSTPLFSFSCTKKGRVKVICFNAKGKYLVSRTVIWILNSSLPAIETASLSLSLTDDASCRARPSGLVIISELSWKTQAGRRKKDSRVNSSFGVAALVSLSCRLFSRIICHDSFRCSSSLSPRPVHSCAHTSHLTHCRRMQLESRSGATGVRSLAHPSLPLRRWKEVCGATSATTRVQRVHRENHYAPRPERDVATRRIVIFPRFLIIKISSRRRPPPHFSRFSPLSVSLIAMESYF